MSELLRNHDYIKALPPLPIECPESQLNPSNMPVIFEENFVDNPTENVMSMTQPEQPDSNIFSSSVSRPVMFISDFWGKDPYAFIKM